MPKRRSNDVQIRSIRRPRHLLVGVLALALLVPAAAIAGQAATDDTAVASKKKGKKKKKGPAGSWNGTVSENGSPITFSVAKGVGSVDNFAAVVLPVYCYGEGFSTRVFLVPSVSVSGRSFAIALPTTNSGGEVDGSFEVSGTLTRNSASGAMRYNRAGCASGPLTWTAERG